jgi:hypothetical protein
MPDIHDMLLTSRRDTSGTFQPTEALKSIFLKSKSKKSLDAKDPATENENNDLSISFHRATADEARELIQKRFEGSTIGELVSELPTFERRELIVGKRLGRGGFSVVDEVKSMRLGKSIETTKKLMRTDSRVFIATHCLRDTGDCRYAIKSLRWDVVNNPDRALMGVCDLVIETKFLSGLEHPHLIKIRGISDSDPFSENYFLVLDRLYDTLEKRILQWKARDHNLKSLVGRMMIRDRGGIERMELYLLRLERAYDLSAAVGYLHGKNILHRDLKPENIGFDCVSPG